VKYRDVVKLIEADGWFHESTNGSHMQYAHPTKPGKVTISGGGKLAREVPPGTLSSILRQAGLKGNQK
jgi:predicted RNA binding protein YcfA (HicA-like mRNA interferase family)